MNTQSTFRREEETLQRHQQLVEQLESSVTAFCAQAEDMNCINADTLFSFKNSFKELLKDYRKLYKQLPGA